MDRSDSTSPEVQVIGPFNSGTCLMFNYIHRLFDVRTKYNQRFWKHSLPPEYRQFTTGSNLTVFDPDPSMMSRTTFIVMVRNPYWWLASTLRKPYLLRLPQEVERAEQRLNSAVRFFERDFDHLVEVWNAYYRAYRHELGRRAKLIYIRLEDLVEDPQRELQRVEWLPPRPGIDRNAVIRATFEEPAKVHGGPCVGGHEAREKYVIDRIPDALGANNLPLVNERTDQELMQEFDYPIVDAQRAAWSRPLVGRRPTDSSDATVVAGSGGSDVSERAVRADRRRSHPSPPLPS